MCPVLPTASSGGGVGSHEGSRSGFDLNVLPEEENEGARPLPNPIDPAPAPDVYHPLMDDNDRRTELENQLRTNFFVRDVTTATPEMINQLIDAQLDIEKAVERTLLDEHYSAQSILEKRTSIRDLMFYPRGKAVTLPAYTKHLFQIRNVGTQGSVPYVRIIKAVRSSHLLLDRTDGLP